MKQEEIQKTIDEQIVAINNKLQQLDEEKGRLITLQTDLEMEKQNKETKLYAERVKKARAKNHRQTEGRVNAKYSLLNKVQETRRARAERLRGKDDR